jgi:predicted RNA binding protein YcfA (HicA-like mRNA interferase family)
MNIFPSLTGREVVSILKKTGFWVERHKGSHVFVKHIDGRETVVPVHAGETIVAGLLMKILNDVMMTEHDILKAAE